MHINDKPRNRIFGGIILIVISGLGSNLVKSMNSVLFNTTLFVVAIWGWIMLIFGIIKWYKERKTKTNS